MCDDSRAVTLRRNPGRSSVAVLVVSLASLAGCSDGTPESGPATTSPAPPAVTSASGPSLTAESLPELAVGAGDLPAGFSVLQEGYVEAGEPIEALFRRSFDPGDAELGSSVLVGLVTDVALFPSSQAAEEALATILDGLSSEVAEANFATIMEAYTGVVPTDLNGQTLNSPVVADGAVAARAFFDSPAGRGEALLYVVRVGRLHADLFLVGEPGRVELEDGAALIAAVTDRIQAAVAAAGPAA